MSMITAPAFERTPKPEHFRAYRGKLWRIVEAQHRISTNRLAAGADDQALLEQLVEEVKPTLPVMRSLPNPTKSAAHSSVRCWIALPQSA
ncbi:hypothetical protein [Sphingopyxis sp. MG]|uniref:hypothetical protein n=1 Tax=Sphingopyxis sp. MG TaxID=1866325 RepID=UPI001F30A32E|nr:hypothetical protein [Sphingopyxis sp. MG]